MSISKLNNNYTTSQIYFWGLWTKNLGLIIANFHPAFGIKQLPEAYNLE